jgi:hypothetical protein
MSKRVVFEDGEVPKHAQYEASLPGTHFLVILIFGIVAASALR